MRNLRKHSQSLFANSNNGHRVIGSRAEICTRRYALCWTKIGWQTVLNVHTAHWNTPCQCVPLAKSFISIVLPLWENALQPLQRSASNMMCNINGIAAINRIYSLLTINFRAMWQCPTLIWVTGYAKRDIVQWESTAKCPFKKARQPYHIHTCINHITFTHASGSHRYSTRRCCIRHSRKHSGRRCVRGWRCRPGRFLPPCMLEIEVWLHYLDQHRATPIVSQGRRHAGLNLRNMIVHGRQT